ncbi:MAG: hypothetical protein OEZ39_13465 [Gammaproteobacteria bacterium]|nr:hypothetical protein [Gammaproteobacteria bacterium]MDH5652859.1 hypothetical protein [Gammaproteobacteria bacterium]
MTKDPYRKYLEFEGDIAAKTMYTATVHYATSKQTKSCASYIWMTGSYVPYHEKYDYEAVVEHGRHSLKIPLHVVEEDECGWKPVFINIVVSVGDITTTPGFYGTTSACTFYLQLKPGGWQKKIELSHDVQEINCVPKSSYAKLTGTPVFNVSDVNRRIVLNIRRHDTYRWKSTGKLTKDIGSEICKALAKPFDNTFFNTVFNSKINLVDNFSRIDCGAIHGVRADNLLKAAAIYREDFIGMLIAGYGLDINARDSRGLTILDWVDLQINNGTKIRHRNSNYFLKVRQQVVNLGGKQTNTRKYPAK